MNKIFIAITICFVSTASSAQVRRWFYQPMNCFVSGSGANCQTVNHRFNPIYCEAEASARTYRGFFLRGFFRGWIQPRQSGYIYINANNPYRDPIVRTQARARCLF